VADANAAGDLSFVTVLAPVEGEAPVDLERLARLSTAEVEHAA
jgi:hypothetical protein